MKHFLLNIIPELDVNFLNETSIEFSINRHSLNDSEWCDFITGSRILSFNDSVIFVAETAEDETVLRLKFGERLK